MLRDGVPAGFLPRCKRLRQHLFKARHLSPLKTIIFAIRKIIRLDAVRENRDLPKRLYDMCSIRKSRRYRTTFPRSMKGLRRMRWRDFSAQLLTWKGKTAPTQRNTLTRG